MNVLCALTLSFVSLLMPAPTIAAPATAIEGPREADESSFTLLYEIESLDPSLDIASLDSLVATYVSNLELGLNDLIGRKGHVQQLGIRGVLIQLEGCSEQQIAGVRGFVGTAGLSGLCFAVDPGTSQANDVDLVGMRDALDRRLEERRGQTAATVDVSDLSKLVGETLYRWVPYSEEFIALQREERGEEATAQLSSADYQLLELDAEGAPELLASDYQSMSMSEDYGGMRAVDVMLKDARAEEFGDVTESRMGSRLAVVVNGRIVSEPARIQSRLGAMFRITSGQASGFSRKEVLNLLLHLQLSSGQLTPKLVRSGPGSYSRIGGPLK